MKYQLYSSLKSFDLRLAEPINNVHLFISANDTGIPIPIDPQLLQLELYPVNPAITIGLEPVQALSGPVGTSIASTMTKDSNSIVYKGYQEVELTTFEEELESIVVEVR